MSKNVQLIILHIAVAVLCFIGALVFFNNRMGMEKGSAVAELANPSYPVLEIGNDTSSYNLMAGYKEDIDLSLVRNQITLTNNKNAVILKLHDYDYDITAIQYTLFEKTPDKPTETGTLNQLTKNKKKNIKLGTLTFKNTLSEGKEAPDYSHSDMFKVELRLSATIKDKAFALFLESVQQSLTEEQKLSVFEIIALDKIRQGNDYKELDRKIIEKLEKRGLIEKRGKTKGAYYILSQSYYEFTDNKVEYFKRTSWDLSQAFSLIVSYLNKNSKAKMGEFVNLFDGHLSRKQVRTFIQQLVDNQILISEGKGYGTSYSLGNDYKKKDELMNKAFILGCEELKRRGEM